MNRFHKFIDFDLDAASSGQTPHARANLHLPLLLLTTRENGELLRTKTDNVDMDGFFCYTKKVFALGERLQFLLKLPSAATTLQEADVVYLQGLVQVVHVSACDRKDDVGIGCRVKHYRVLSKEELLSREDVVRTFLECRFLDPGYWFGGRASTLQTFSTPEKQ